MRTILRGLLLASTVFVVSACGKDGGGGAAGGGANAADLGYLPAESMVVAGLNMKQLQGSGLYKEYVEPRIMSADAQSQITEFKATCGFDPTQVITSVSIGAKGMANGSIDGIVVVHGPDKTATLACLDKLKDKLATQGVTMAKDGDVVIVTNRGQSGALVFANDSTLVAGAGSYATAAAVKAAAAGTSTLKSSPAFVDMYSKLDTSKSIWFFISGKLSAFEAAESMLGARPKSFFGALNVTEGLNIDTRIRFADNGKAAELAKTFAGQADGMKAGGMATQASITADGPDVHFTAQMTGQQLKDTIKQMAPIVGMMMGGM